MITREMVFVASARLEAEFGRGARVYREELPSASKLCVGIFWLVMWGPEACAQAELPDAAGVPFEQAVEVFASFIRDAEERRRVAGLWPAR